MGNLLGSEMKRYAKIIQSAGIKGRAVVIPVGCLVRPQSDALDDAAHLACSSARRVANTRGALRRGRAVLFESCDDVG